MAGGTKSLVAMLHPNNDDLNAVVRKSMTAAATASRSLFAIARGAGVVRTRSKSGRFENSVIDVDVGTPHVHLRVHGVARI
jgi:hypothetical protein